MRFLLIPAFSAVLAFSACGDEDRPVRGASGPTSPATGTETAPPAPDPGATDSLTPADQARIRKVVLAAVSNREPCAHLTRRYLEEFVLDNVTSDDPVAACREAEEGQQELPDSQVRIVAVRGGGSRAEVRFSIAGVEQRAMLVRSRGEWLIDKLDV